MLLSSASVLVGWGRDGITLPIGSLVYQSLRFQQQLPRSLVPESRDSRGTVYGKTSVHV